MTLQVAIQRAPAIELVAALRLGALRLAALLSMVVPIGAQSPATGAQPGPGRVPPRAVVQIPADAPPAIARLLGLYVAGTAQVLIAERDGRAWAVFDDGIPARLDVRGDTLRPRSPTGPGALIATRDASGRVKALTLAGVQYRRRALGPDAGNQLVVTPVRPLEQLRQEALAASPPVESNRDATPDLAELVTLDSTIHLEIRYATANNLFGERFYSQARAFLQRPAAAALVRASAALKPYGVGLLVHDGYRPWYVTKMFWDAASPEVRPFVANPAEGSKHNRGAAVDLSLYDWKTGRPIEMPSTYDETTLRASPDWAGGTSRQRWYRDLLRRVMEAEGFTVYQLEWWHFDFTGWEQYPILNVPFERLGSIAR